MFGICRCKSLQPSRDWVKGKLIGSGSYGSVHLAVDITTGGLFVVKSAQFGAGIRALKNQAEMLESLNSPHIVKCLGKNMSNGEEINVLMEYMGGGSLSDLAEKFGGSLQEGVIRVYSREILKGLKHVHENGIVHCDLKCKNVLLGSSGNVKLADFGSARRIKRDHHVKDIEIIGGTPLWMAPELLRNEGLDFASDIWSFGCTVIEMATGRPPWIHDHHHHHEISNPMALVLKSVVGDEKPDFPKSFSKMGLDFLARCLNRDPKKRWSAAELLKHPFVSSKNCSREEEVEVEKVQHKWRPSCSPASVLEIDIVEEGGNSNKKNNMNNITNDERNPFSRSNFDERKRMLMVRRQQVVETCEFNTSSESWITVR